MSSKKQAVLVLGGAGFIGSHIADRFQQEGWAVTVLDGLLAKTGGRTENVAALIGKINFVSTPIESTPNLSDLINQADVIVDAMAWTAHTLALKDPLYDMRLNVESHLHLIQELADHPAKRVLYLGSRGQYGNPKTAEITEDTPMAPEDVQGTHKLSAESAFRIFSKASGMNVVSLRFGNCYGPRQMADGADLGLVGNFVRDLLEGRTISLFGGGRFRNIIYVKDVADVVFKLATASTTGFQAFNLAGERMTIGELVKTLIAVMGKGAVEEKPMPEEIKAMDIGNAVFSEAKLKKFLGVWQATPLKTGLADTIHYFRSLKRDLSM